MILVGTKIKTFASYMVCFRTKKDIGTKTKNTRTYGDYLTI